MVVIITYYKFPCKQQALENIFAKELGKRVKILWLLQGDTSRGKIKRWHHSIVLLSRSINEKNRLSKIVNAILQLTKILQLFYLLRNKDVKIIMVRDQPIMAFITAIIKIHFNFKLYFQYSAPLGDIKIAHFKVSRKLNDFWYYINGKAYNLLYYKNMKFADYVFPISSFHKKELLFYTSKEKLVPITMGIDEEWVNKSRKKIPDLEKLKKEYFLIAYFGSINSVRNPKFILLTFLKVKERVGNCRLLIIGKTNSRTIEKNLFQFCNNLGLQKEVIFTGELDRQKLLNYLNYCDISISPIPPERYYRNSSPTKLYESIGIGLPVVANNGIYEHEKVIKESGGGIIVDYDTTSFSNGIIKILQNKKIRDKIKRTATKYIIENYSYEKIARSLFSYFS